MKTEKEIIRDRMIAAAVSGAGSALSEEWFRIAFPIELPPVDLSQFLSADKAPPATMPVFKRPEDCAREFAAMLGLEYFHNPATMLHIFYKPDEKPRDPTKT